MARTRDLRGLTPAAMKQALLELEKRVAALEARPGAATKKAAPKPEEK